jgi:hypothetical protein
MSAHPQAQLDAIAFQLAATIDSYEQHVEELLAAWPDMERYRTVSESIEEIRRYASALPAVSVQFVALLIAHTELVHALWKQTNDPGHAANPALAPAREQHGECIAALRQKCRGLLRATTESGGNH